MSRGRRQRFRGSFAGVRAVTAASGSFDGADVGALAPVEPPCDFGFSSTPRRPSVTSVVTTVDVLRPRSRG